jgi:hypothetical protein
MGHEDSMLIFTSKLVFQIIEMIEFWYIGPGILVCGVIGLNLPLEVPTKWHPARCPSVSPLMGENHPIGSGLNTSTARGFELRATFAMEV